MVHFECTVAVYTKIDLFQQILLLIEVPISICLLADIQDYLHNSRY
jgi:hypothetical protein